MSDSKYEPLPEHIKERLRKLSPPSPPANPPFMIDEVMAKKERGGLELAIVTLAREYERKYGPQVASVSFKDDEQGYRGYLTIEIREACNQLAVQP